MSVVTNRVDNLGLDGFDRRWAVGGLTLVAGLLGLLSYPTALNLGRQWYSDENYSHGFLIPLVSAYLLWGRRHELQRISPRSSIVGLVVMTMGLGLFVLSAPAQGMFPQRLSLLIVLTGLVLWVLGHAFLRVLAVPLAMLLFTIPLPAIVLNAVAFPLQGFAARVAEQTLWLLGIPVLREGNVITLANTSLEVAEACSGIRSLVTLMAIAATFACVRSGGWWRGAGLIAATVPIAVGVNAARVAGTGVLAYRYGPAVAEGFFHSVSGWLLFVVAAGLLCVCGLILSMIKSRPRRATSSVEHVATDGVGSVGKSGLTWRLGVAAGMIAIAVVMIGSAPPVEGVALRRSFDSFPDRLDAWQGMRESLPLAVVDSLLATDYVNRLYVRPDSPPVWLHVAYYENQRTGGQSIHSPRLCIPGGGWAIVDQRPLIVSFAGQSAATPINQVMIAKDGQRQIVLYWFQERGRIIADEYSAAWYLFIDAVRSGRTDGALVRVSAPFERSEEATVQAMLQFITAMYPALVESLPR